MSSVSTYKTNDGTYLKFHLRLTQIDWPTNFVNDTNSMPAQERPISWLATERLQKYFGMGKAANLEMHC